MPASAGDTGWMHGPGRFHMPRSKVPAPWLLKPRVRALQLETPLQREPTHHTEEPHSLQLERAGTQQQRLGADINKLINFKKRLGEQMMTEYVSEYIVLAKKFIWVLYHGRENQTNFLADPT